MFLVLWDGRVCIVQEIEVAESNEFDGPSSFRCWAHVYPGTVEAEDAGDENERDVEEKDAETQELVVVTVENTVSHASTKLHLGHEEISRGLGLWIACFEDEQMANDLAETLRIDTPRES